MRFSLLFFAQNEVSGQRDRYRLLTECTTFADAHGFEAVWIPERHFHPLGGIYPNPAVVAASLAPQTRRIRLRAGSVVLPLHHPAHVVEQWAVVDHLSGGRVDLAVASGWNADDFVLAPASFGQHREIWLQRIDMIRRLWSGQSVAFPNGEGNSTSVTVHPRPLQEQVALWMAVSRRLDSFELAGKMGLNVLTMLSGINLAQLKERVDTYRRARAEVGLDPAVGVVTLMLHSYVLESSDAARDLVRQPLLEYIKGSATAHVKGGAVAMESEASQRQIDRMAEFSFERYLKMGSLIGDLSAAREMAIRTGQAGVDEIACMMDFGLTVEQIQDSLPVLDRLRDELSTE